MKLSETANKVIALAAAIRDYWDAELPKRHPDYPLVHPGEDDGPPPPEEKKLKNFLAKLPEDMIYKLGLLSYVGRGSYGPNDLSRAYETVKHRFGPPEEAAAELAEEASLADNLIDGLTELRKSGLDIDHLQLAPANSNN